MGRPFLVEFDKTANNRFYLCGSCQTHIALSNDLQYNFKDCELSGSIFENVINVQRDGPQQERWVGERLVTDVYCQTCGYLLGIIFVKVARRDGTVRDGNFLLNMNNLLMWNGFEVVAAWDKLGSQL